MKRPVRWSEDALRDLTEQISYIRNHNPSAALRVAEAVDASAGRLGEFATGRPGRVAGTYEKSVSGMPYIIAYTIAMIEGAENVFVLRVIHSSRNWLEDQWPE